MNNNSLKIGRAARAFAFVLAAVMSVYCFVPVSYADFDRTEAQNIYKSIVVNEELDGNYATAVADSGQIILSGNGRKRVKVGNLVKLMTLLITFEKIDSGAVSAESEFSVSKHAQDVSVGRARVYLDSGKREKISVGQAVEAICINGAQDAACALSEFIGGSEESFVAMMNTRASEMGLSDTLFTDSTGIDADQYSCAEDIAKIMCELVGKHPSCLSYLNLTYGLFKHTSTGQGETEMVSSNPLNRRKFFEESDGSMLGYSADDKYSIACTATKDEKRVVSVVLGEENENARAAKVKKLAEYSRANYTYMMLCREGTFVKKVDIFEGKNKKIMTETAGDCYVLLNVSDASRVTTAIELDHELKAPIEEGVPCGYVVYYLGEKELGRVELVTAEKMERANWFVRLIRRILAFFGL